MGISLIKGRFPTDGGSRTPSISNSALPSSMPTGSQATYHSQRLERLGPKTAPKCLLIDNVLQF